MIKLFLLHVAALLCLSPSNVGATHDPYDCQAGTEVIVNEDFETYNAGDDMLSQGWKNGMIDYDDGFTTFLGRFMEKREGGQGSRHEDPRVNFPVPAHADYLILSFDFYEIDGWADADCFYVYVNGEKIPLNFFEADVDERYKTGFTRYGITWTLDSRAPPNQIGFGPVGDQIHHVIAKIPKSHFTDELKLRFVTQVNADAGESSGIDNLKIEAVYQCVCEPYRFLFEEDFEDKSTAGWLNGKTMEDEPHFTNFLGPYDSTSNDFELDPLKVYIVDDLADALTFEFDFYEFDQWEGEDCLYVYVNGVRVFLGFYNMDVNEGLRNGTARKGIRWEVESFDEPTNLGGNDDFNDQQHHVTIHIPKRVYRRSSVLEVRFATRINGTVENESAGFDNIKVIGYYDCANQPSPSPSEQKLAPPAGFDTASPTVTDSPSLFSPAFTPAYTPIQNPADTPHYNPSTPVYSPAHNPAYSPAYTPTTPAYTPTTPAYTPNYQYPSASPSLVPSGSFLPSQTATPTSLRCEDKPDDITFFVSLDFFNVTCSWLAENPDWISQVCTPAFTAWFWCPITCGRFT